MNDSKSSSSSSSLPKDVEVLDMKCTTLNSSGCIELDGSLLEGGGQVLRNGIAYAALLGQPVQIVKIRAGREKGGLRPQHLTGIKLVQEIVGGPLTNDYPGATDITYKPGKGSPFQNEYYFEADAQTAGATMLMMQTSLPVLLFLPSKALTVLKGGTNAIKAPLIDYAQQIFLPIFNRFTGADVDVKLVKRGYFPRGGGIVEVRTKPYPGALPPFELVDRGTLTHIHGVASVSGRVNLDVAKRMEKAALAELRTQIDPSVPIEIKCVVEDRQLSPSDGVFLFLKAETSTGCYFGESVLGEKGLPAEKVAKAATTELLADIAHGGCVDQWLQDQLIIYMALAKGHSKVLSGPLTLHTRTAIHWAAYITGAKFTLTPKSATTVLIECDGIGYQSRFAK